MSEGTQILTALELGDSQAADELLPLVYAELRQLAARKLSYERPGQTLQATLLAHKPLPGFMDSLVMGFSFIFRDGTVARTYRIQRSPSMAEGSWVHWQSFTYTEPIFLTAWAPPVRSAASTAPSAAEGEG